jgi:hypothetical protein
MMSKTIQDRKSNHSTSRQGRPRSRTSPLSHHPWLRRKRLPLEEASMIIPFDSVAQGISHKENEKPVQDAACSATRSFAGGEVAIAIVADGHGGEKYLRSAEGAAMAVREAQAVLLEFCGEIYSRPDALGEMRKNVADFVERNLPMLEQKILERWRRKTLAHFRVRPLTDQEADIAEKHHLDTGSEDIAVLYGTTLVAALLTPDFHLSIHIGDGRCVIVEADGRCEAAVPEDEAQGFGLTHSLCGSQALNEFRHAFGTRAISGMVAATDGVVDSFLPESYAAFIVDRLRAGFIADPETTREELKRFLPSLSERGSRDDCAIAGFWRVEDAETPDEAQAPGANPGQAGEPAADAAI